VAAVGGHVDASACPELAAYYYASQPQEWELVSLQLAPLLPECLQSTEYFALLGASQLNTGRLVQALESLERSLLLDPDNGAASIDYAEALFQAGQLFPALELNQNLLARSDLPSHLQVILNQRQTLWQSRTVSRGISAELAFGHDDNLNGAPSRADLTLTLSGEPIFLTLDQANQPISAPYARFRLAGVYQKATPDFSHDMLAAVTSRNSEHPETDLLQLDWRYSLGQELLRRQWSLQTGVNHLSFGGSPLYSVADARFQLQTGNGGCQPRYGVAGQYQLYHGQSIFSGIETSATAGLHCRPGNRDMVFGLDLSWVANLALEDNRPGGDRDGWRLQLGWRQALGRGLVDAQYSFSTLQDDSGYSDLLDNGARRQVYSRLLRVQYRQPLAQRLDFQMSLSHQGQSSNLVPFQNTGTGLELGLSYAL